MDGPSSRARRPRRWLGGVAAAAAVTVALTPGLAPAAPGELDRSFGGSGKALAAFVDGGITDVAVQPDGKIVVAGRSGGDFAVARYRADGALDWEFAAGEGRTRTDFGEYEGGATGVALQPDGKIVLAGSVNNSSGCRLYALARYNPDGTPDAEFGEGGKLITYGFGCYYDPDIMLQLDGKIVIGSGNGIGSFAVLRYLRDGRLDESFGSEGRVVTPVSADGYPVAQGRALELQPDGKIVLAGSAMTPRGAAYVVVRFDSRGELDASFGRGGRVDAHPGNDESFAYAQDMLRQPDGKLVIVGEVEGSVSGIGNVDDFGLVRLTADGALDTTFAGDGTTTTEIAPGIGSANAVALMRDGSLVVAGNTGGGDGLRSGFAVVRYTPSGMVDRSFGSAGVALTDFGSTNDVAEAIALQSDGRAVVAGSSSQPWPSSGAVSAVARYLNEPTVVLPPPPPPPPPPARERPGVPIQEPGQDPPAPSDDSRPPASPIPNDPAPTAVPRTAPVPAKLRLSGLRATVDRRGRVTVRLRVSQATRLLVRIVKLRAGTRRRGRCVTLRTRAPASGRRCDLVVMHQTVSVQSGPVAIRLERSLPKGRYRVEVVALRRSGATTERKHISVG